MVGCGQFAGGEGPVGAVEPAGAVFARALLLAGQCQHEVEGQFLIQEMAEGGTHCHYAAAVVVASQAPDRIGVIAGVQRVARVTLRGGDGIDVRVQHQRPGAAAALEGRKVVAVAHAGESPFQQPRRNHRADRILAEGHGRNPHHIAQQRHRVFDQVLFHRRMLVPEAPRGAELCWMTTRGTPCPSTLNAFSSFGSIPPSMRPSSSSCR